jgi:phosphate starvation-inducible PhoH-like protein
LEDVHFSTLGSADVVRHRLVSEIVDAYERWDALQEAAEAPRQVTGGPNRRNNNRRR